MTFDRDSGLEELQRKEFRVFHHLPDVIQQGLGTSTALPADIGVEAANGSGTPSVVVAASDASDLSKSKADLRCTGVADDLIIQAAIALLATTGGTVWLTEGTFNISAQINVTADASQHIHVRGLGPEITILAFTGVSSACFKTTGSAVGHSFSDFTLNNIGSNNSGIWITFVDCQVWNVTLRGHDQFGIFVDGTGSTADRCVLSNIRVLSGNGILSNNGDHLVINGFQADAANTALTLTSVNNVIVSAMQARAGAFASVKVNNVDNLVLDIAVMDNPWTFGILDLDDLTNSIIRVSSVGSVDKVVRLQSSSADNHIHVVAELDGAATDNAVDAVFVEGTCDRNLITGMIRPFDGTHRWRYGVNISASGCSDNRVMVDVEDPGTADINDIGTGTLIGPGPHEWNLGLPAGRSTDHSVKWDGSNFVLATGDGATAADLDTATGPDASDFWQMVEIDGGDSFVIQQWDDSASAFIERIEIVGKGTGLTDAGDIKLYDQDGNEIARWDNSVGEWVFTKSVTVDTVSTTAAKPVLQLNQADVDEDYFKFVGTSDTNVDRALVDAVNFTTPGSIVGWIKVNVQDDQGTDPIVDGDYYIPFYGAPSA